MAPGTEFARDFCAGIGPLQLGVVLVYLFSKLRHYNTSFCSSLLQYHHSPISKEISLCPTSGKTQATINLILTTVF